VAHAMMQEKIVLPASTILGVGVGVGIASGF
jgi:hypothetical protein